MKELKTNNAGRMPLWQADLDWIQAGYTEPIEALVKELGLDKSYFAITGCVPYKPNIKTLAMDAGWFWWNGKILPVRALSTTDVLSFTNPMVRLTKETYSNPEGARSFIHADLSTETIINVWQDDYLTPTVVERSAAFTSGVRLGIGAWTLRDIIQHHYSENESDWHVGHAGTLQYKLVGRMVVLKGTCSVDSSFQPIDEGFPAPMEGLAVLHPHVAPEDVYIAVDSQGGLISQSSAQTIPISVNLTGMMYMAATPYQTTDPNTINDNPQS